MNTKTRQSRLLDSAVWEVICREEISNLFKKISTMGFNITEFVQGDSWRKFMEESERIRNDIFDTEHDLWEF